MNGERFSGIHRQPRGLVNNRTDERFNLWLSMDRGDQCAEDMKSQPIQGCTHRQIGPCYDLLILMHTS